MADFQKDLGRLAVYLETRNGRDKAFRVLSYFFKMLGHLAERRGNYYSAERYTNVANQFGGWRVLLRLFDDVPMLAYSLSYGLGHHEKDQTTRVLNIVKNCCDQLYFPTEHFAWAVDSQLIAKGSDSTPIWQLGDCFWTGSLVIGIILSAREIKAIDEEYKKLPGDEKISSVGRSLERRKISQQLSIVKNSADLVNAINWLPGNILWAGKLNAGWVGFFGTISSVVGIYQSYPASQ
eukprot:Clim_evm35s34 gene=Clim_evmTU35s34